MTDSKRGYRWFFQTLPARSVLILTGQPNIFRNLPRTETIVTTRISLLP